MKKLFLLLSVLACFFAGTLESDAQYAQVYRKGTALYSDGLELTPDQMQVLFEGAGCMTYSDWQNAVRGFNTGKGLLIGFGALTGTGLVTFGVGVVGLMAESVAVGIGTAFIGPFAAASGRPPVFEYDSKFAGVALAGTCMIGAGLMCMAAGTTVYCIYRKKLDRMADACNNPDNDVQLSFGMTSHGIGLSLNF